MFAAFASYSRLATAAVDIDSRAAVAGAVTAGVPVAAPTDTSADRLYSAGHSTPAVRYEAAFGMLGAWPKLSVCLCLMIPGRNGPLITVAQRWPLPCARQLIFLQWTLLGSIAGLEDLL